MIGRLAEWTSGVSIYGKLNDTRSEYVLRPKDFNRQDNEENWLGWSGLVVVSCFNIHFWSSFYPTNEPTCGVAKREWNDLLEL